MKVYVLMSEENDSHDVGTHLEIVDIFVKREDAEHVRGMLIGKRRHQVSWGEWLWYADQLEIEEWEIR
jgi:hypothetical protein